MAHDRRFRFGAQVHRASSAREWRDTARKAEDLGFSTLTLPDHFGDQFAPAPALMAAADATTALRVGALVWDNDYRHPLVLAKELATLDLLSDGRLEIGLGAGWMLADYEASGIPYDPPAVRIERFAEGLAVIKGLLGPGPFSFSGRHYRIADHEGRPKPVQQPRPPILVGGGGRRVLSLAAREADIVGINADLRAGRGGPETAPNLTVEATDRKLAWVREAAGDRFDRIELHTLVGFAMVTDDPAPILAGMAGHFGCTPDEASHVPVCLVGTAEQMVEELQWRRERWGVSYVTFEGDWEALAPVVARLAGT